MMDQTHELALSVSNVSALASGCVAQMTCQDSLLIGASREAQWYLDDHTHHVEGRQCQIQRVDGVFCIVDLCAGTYVNGATSPLGEGKRARLNVDDEIRIGTLLIRVGLEHADEERLVSIDEVFEPLLPSGDDIELKQAHSIDVDPINKLDALLSVSPSEEKKALDDWLQSTTSPQVDAFEPILPFTPQSDSEFELSSSMVLKSRQEKSGSQTEPNLNPDAHDRERFITTMMESAMTHIQQEPDDLLWGDDVSQGKDHLLAGPILSGLGASLSGKQNVADLHALSHDIGESLQACIKGLLAVHQQVSEGRFGTFSRNLQPIEDNPLRLGLSYQDTISTMFDEAQSAVHLSPASAIAESLKQINDHHTAMLHATSVALAQILEAFSPVVLLRRFSQYRRNPAQISQETDRWAWQMYSDYYQELTSSRQQGFEKLYWEIFEQAYDRKLREIQRER